MEVKTEKTERRRGGKRDKQIRDGRRRRVGGTAGFKKWGDVRTQSMDLFVRDCKRKKRWAESANETERRRNRGGVSLREGEV